MARLDGKIAGDVTAYVVPEPYPHIRIVIDGQESLCEVWQAAYLAGLLIGCIQQIQQQELAAALLKRGS